MSKNSKTQSVTIVGGRNIAPTETKAPRGRPPKGSKPDEPSEPEKEPKNK